METAEKITAYVDNLVVGPLEITTPTRPSTAPRGGVRDTDWSALASRCRGSDCKGSAVALSIIVWKIGVAVEPYTSRGPWCPRTRCNACSVTEDRDISDQTDPLLARRRKVALNLLGEALRF